MVDAAMAVVGEEELHMYTSLVGHLPSGNVEREFVQEMDRLAGYRRQALLDALLGSMDMNTETPERQEARLSLFMEECLHIQPDHTDAMHSYMDALVRDRRVGDGVRFWTCMERLCASTPQEGLRV